MDYKIKQLKHNHNDIIYRFMDFDFAQDNGFNLNDYDTIYTNSISASDNVYSTLEDLFYQFNCRIPADFSGHALSVSDVVELNGINYYCNNIGWKPV